MKEILKNNLDSGVENLTSVDEKTTVNKEELAKQALVEDEKLKTDVSEDKNISSEKYEKILQETKGMKNPELALEDVNKQLEQLNIEVATSKADYKNLFLTYSYDAPNGGTSYRSKESALVSKYPGLDKIVEVIQKAKEASRPTKTDETADNLMGRWFGAKKMKDAEITAGSAQRIDNALTSGSVGINATSESYKPVVEFLAKNSPELLKTQRYQNIINEIGKTDANFLEANQGLLVKPEEIINQSTCIREVIGQWQEEKNIKIKELEAQKFELEGKLKEAA